MKKKFILAIFLCASILISGCNDKKTFESFAVAVVETTSNKKASLITYYDKNLNIVHTKSLKYAELGSNFYNPAYLDDNVYLVPRGLQGKHDEKKVISLDFKTGENSEYHVNRANIICTAVSEDYLFAGSNLNYTSYLTRTKIKDHSIKELSFAGEYLSLIALSNKYVFAFLNTTNKQSIDSKINIYDIENLEFIKSINISEYGVDQTKYYLDNDKLYFSNNYDKNDNPTNTIGILDTNDFSLSKVTLSFNHPDDIQYVNQDTLLISCTDVVRSNGSKVVILNTKTGEQLNYDLNVPILSIQVANNLLFVLTSEYYLNVYDINHDMKLIQSVPHKLTKGTYLSTIFVDK